MANKFLNFAGLTTLFNKLVEKFTPVLEKVSEVEADTEYYVTNVDYDLIKFDTSEIVSDFITIYEDTVITESNTFEWNGLTFTDSPSLSIDFSLLNYNVSQYTLTVDGVSKVLKNGSANEDSLAWTLFEEKDDPDPSSWEVGPFHMIVAEKDSYGYVISTRLGEVGSEHHLKISYNPSDLVK